MHVSNAWKIQATKRLDPRGQQRKVNLSHEMEERRRIRQRAPTLFKPLVSNIICFFYAVNTFFPILCRPIRVSFRLYIILYFRPLLNGNNVTNMTFRLFIKNIKKNF